MYVSFDINRIETNILRFLRLLVIVLCILLLNCYTFFITLKNPYGKKVIKTTSFLTIKSPSKYFQEDQITLMSKNFIEID